MAKILCLVVSLSIYLLMNEIRLESDSQEITPEEEIMIFESFIQFERMDEREPLKDRLIVHAFFVSKNHLRLRFA